MINIRPGIVADRSFILGSWMKTYAANNRDQPRWALRWQDKMVKDILEMADVLVACPEGDNDTIVGWMCHVGPVVQFCYVKKPFRGFGVGKQLFTASGLQEPYLVAYKPPGIKRETIYVPQFQYAGILREMMNEDYSSMSK